MRQAKAGMSVLLWARAVMLLFIFLSPIMGASESYGKDESNCDEVMNTFDIAECATRSYEKADKELNEVYKKLIALHEQALQKTRADNDKDTEDSNLEIYYSKLSLDSLRQSQRDWIKFRDHFCKYATSLWTTGTGARIIHPSCLTKLTEEQTQRLRQYLEE